MKKNLIHIILAFAAICGSGYALTSCQDDLDVTPDGRMTVDAMFSTPENTKAYFASAWSHVPQKMFMYYFFDNFLIDMADEGWSTADYISYLLIGNLYAGNVNTTKHRFEWDDTAQGKWDGGYWVRYWQMIRILNNCIKHFPDAAFDSEEEREQCMAEARILRAFYYLQMVKFYGDLPIITDVYGVTTSYAGLERNPAYEVLQHIVSECEAALECPYLPWSINNVQLANRMTKGIACAIISQASLFAASPLFCKDQDLWQYAYEKNSKAYKLLKENGYELYTTRVSKRYKDAYHEYFASRSYAGSKANDKETIWGSPMNWGVNHATINGAPIYAKDTHQAGCIPTQEMVDAYDMLATGEPIYDLANPYVDEKHSDINLNPKSGYDPTKPYTGRDPRFYASILYNGSKINNGVVDQFVYTWNNEQTWDGGDCSYEASDKDKNTGETITSANAKIDPSHQRYTRTGYYNNKYHAYAVNPESVNAIEGNWKYYRLGEIYLNLAECAVEVGKTDEAMELVNEIRHRAGFAAAVDKKASGQTDARLIVRHERQVELMFEEHRYFDCRRWGTSDQDIVEERYNTGMWIHKNGKEYVYVRFPLGRDQGRDLSKQCSAAKYRLVPIPQSESSTLGTLTGFGADYWQNPGWE